jgi:HSP20 family molecular chaperone IbpA
MVDSSEFGSSGGTPPGRPRGSGSLTVHLADELDVYFNEVAHGRPVGFVASPGKPRTDVYETDEEPVVYMDIAGCGRRIQRRAEEGILKISGERTTRQQGKRHYHAMEVQIGPFERRFRLPVVVDPASIRATYEHGFLEIRLAKQPPTSSGAQSVRVGGA